MDFEYKNFKFKKISTGWQVTLPSGFTTKIPEKSPEDLQQDIDALEV